MEGPKRSGSAAERIAAVVAKMDDVDAEMWEISENLHRSDFVDEIERSEAIHRWRELREIKARGDNLSPLGGRQPADRQVKATADDLNIRPRDVRAASSVAALSDEAKEEARATKLGNNRTALVEAREAGNGDAQAEVKYLRDRVATRDAELPGQLAESRAGK